MNLFSEENVSFIYSIIRTLFLKIAYYFSRLSRALKLTSLWSKNVFLNFVEKCVRLKLKKKKVKGTQMQI